jgi:hypothetical protein
MRGVLDNNGIVPLLRTADLDDVAVKRIAVAQLVPSDSQQR